MDVERIISTHITLSLSQTASSSTPSVSPSVSQSQSQVPALASDPPPQELVTAVQDGTVGLLEVVRGLKDYLTSTDDRLRGRGINLLTGLLTRAPPEKINRQATQVLTTFFTDKLDDGEVLPAVVTALTALSKLKTFGDGEAVQVWQGLSENVKMRAFVQSTRHLVYLLVDSLLSAHKEALRKLGPDFISQYVKLVEGEKDPRNLMLVFSLDLVIILDFDPWVHLEDLFDVVFCYFPITFRPPPGDPYGITSDDLKLALRKCMAASPRFAPLALPLFLEKLPPSLGSTKRDILQSLTTCLPIYGAQAVAGYAGDIWDAVKAEIFYSSDADIEHDALATFRALISTMYPTAESQSSDFVAGIVRECQDAFKEPEKTKAKAATKIICACLEASPFVGKFSVAQVLPQLFRAYHTESEIPYRTAIVGIIADILQGIRNVYRSNSSMRKYDAERSIDPYRDELLRLLGNSVANDRLGLKRAGLRGLLELAQIPSLLTLDAVAGVVAKMTTLLNCLDDRIRNEATGAIAHIALVADEPVLSHTLPALFNKLPDQAPGIDEEETRWWYRQNLASLSKICVLPGFVEALMIRIINRLEGLSQSVISGVSDSADPIAYQECQVAYAHALLKCWIDTLSQKPRSPRQDRPGTHEKMIECLLSIAVTGAKNGTPLADPRLLQDYAEVLSIEMILLPPEQQQSVATEMLASFLSGSLGREVKNHLSTPKLSLYGERAKEAGDAILPLQLDGSDAERSLFIVLSGALRPLPSKVSEFAMHLVNWSLTAPAPAVEPANLLLASIINKHVDRNQSTSNGNLDLGRYNRHYSGFDEANPKSTQIGRALAVRNHPSGLGMLAQTLDLLGSGHPLSATAAVNLRIMADPKGDKALSKAEHAVTKPLYKQKLFSSLLPAIVHGCKAKDSAYQLNYISALGSLISVIPRSMIVGDMTTTLPLLLRGIVLPDPTARCKILETLLSILETEDDTSKTFIERHLKDIIDSLLAVTDDRRPKASMTVAKGQKPRVVSALALAVDDPKKQAREEAVDARARWFKV